MHSYWGWFRTHWLVLLGLLVGFLGGIAVAGVKDSSAKVYLAGACALLFLFFLIVSRHRETWCLIALWFAVPFPMHLFVVRLNPLHGGGAIGIYFKAAEIIVAILAVLWLSSRSFRPLRKPGIVWLLVPFLVIGGLSIAWAANSFWAFCEWIRWVKIAVIMAVIAAFISRSQVEISVLAMAASTTVQSIISILQAATKSRLGLDKLELFGSGGLQAVEHELVSRDVFFRGSGLTGHPNFLSSYLLIVLPIFGLLMLAEPNKRLRPVWGLTFVLGFGGLLCTLSRGAWVSFVGAAGLAFAGAALFGLISRRATIIITLVTLASTAVMAQAFGDLVMKRFRSDWDESWQLRASLNRSSLAMGTDHFVGGVGLNNYTIVYPEYDPAFARQLMEMDNMLTAVHNVFLLVFAEVGAVGLVAFLFFYGGVLWLCLRHLRQKPLWERCYRLGLACGLLGALAFDFTSLSLWVESQSYAVAILVAQLPALSHKLERIRDPRVV